MLLVQRKEDLVLLGRQVDVRTGSLAAGKPEGMSAMIDKMALKVEVSRTPVSEVADDAILEA